MSDKECKKIIDRAIESNQADAAAEAHARTCPKCASTLALLALLKTTGSPTTDLTPSAAFLAGIENSLTVTAAEGAGAIALKTKVLAAVIGAALTATIALTIISHSAKTDTNNTATTQSNSITSPESTSGQSGAAGEVTPDNDDAAFPQLKFPSPTDEIK